jgi:hypothetical protein
MRLNLRLAALAFAAVIDPSRAFSVRRSISEKLACLLPNWTISNLTVSYSDDSFVPGNTTFSLWSSLSNTTEDIKCEVPFNYACRLNGTPKNKDLNLQLQFGPDSAIAILNQTWVCADTPGQPAT